MNVPYCDECGGGFGDYATSSTARCPWCGMNRRQKIRENIQKIAERVALWMCAALWLFLSWLIF